MSDPWLAVGALALVGLLIPLGMMAVSWLLRPSVPESDKRVVYESGEVPTGGTRIRFNIQYYMVALLFVIFDVETVLIFPWVLVFRDPTGASVPQILLPMLGFIGILLVGLAWAWRQGVVSWARSVTAEQRRIDNRERTTTRHE